MVSEATTSVDSDGIMVVDNDWTWAVLKAPICALVIALTSALVKAPTWSVVKAAISVVDSAEKASEDSPARVAVSSTWT